MKFILITQNEEIKYKNIEDLRKKIEELLINKIREISNNDIVMLVEDGAEDEEDFKITFHIESELSEETEIVLDRWLKETGETDETKQILSLLNIEVKKEFQIAVKEVNEKIIDIREDNIIKALDKVELMYYNKEIILDNHNEFMPVEIYKF